VFNLDANAGQPIYRQLIEQVKRLIVGGQLQVGDPLPSVRDLAQRHAINPMTISKAYSLLEAEGLLARHRGKPMTIARPPEQSPALLLAPSVDTLIRSGRQLGLDNNAILNAVQKGLETPHD